MYKFLKQLKDEHDQITELLESFREQLATDRWEAALATLSSAKRLIRGIHHRKEEEILFPALEKTGSLPMGGPACGLFMQLKLDADHAADLRAEGAKHGIQPKPRPEDHPCMAAIRSQSPLIIPLEEHDAGGVAFALLEKTIAARDPYARVIGQEFLAMMSQHIRKENECLFELAQSLLSPEQDRELLEAAKAITPTA